MKRPAKAPHKSHKSHKARAECLIAHSPDSDCVRHAGGSAGPRAEPRGSLDRIPGRVPPQASERVFAAVRPGFVAPCMVEATATARGRSGGSRCQVWPGAAGIGPRHCGSSEDDLDGWRRASRNRQREYLAEARAGSRGKVRRIAAITARECADAQDLLLATLSS
jgi:hypothetical protein